MRASERAGGRTYGDGHTQTTAERSARHERWSDNRTESRERDLAVGAREATN